MSLVTLHSGGVEVTGEAMCSRTWRLPSAGEAGQATVTIPYTSPLVAAVDLNAGISVLIHDTGGCGPWWGVVIDASWSEAGITLAAQQVWMMLGRRHVQLTGVRRAVSPAMIVHEAVQSGGLVLGMAATSAPFDGDGPLVDIWEWDDQDVWSAISEMMGRSRSELWVDPVSRDVSWIGPLAEAAAYGTLLIAGQNLRGWSVQESNADRVSEVFGSYNSLTQSTDYGSFQPSGAFRYSTTYGENAVAGWPAQAAVSAESPSGIRDAAEAEFAHRAVPSVAISGSLSRDHIDIRERMYVEVFMPRKGLTYQSRVMARTDDDASDDIGVELLALPTNTVTTTTKAPGWVSRARGRGTGSVAQRIVQANRRGGRQRLV